MTATKKARLTASAIRELQRRRLAEWTAEATERAKRLDRALVWSLVREHYVEARDLGLLQELRDVCFVAVGRVADPRMLRLTQCYRRAAKAE